MLGAALLAVMCECSLRSCGAVWGLLAVMLLCCSLPRSRSVVTDHNPAAAALQCDRTVGTVLPSYSCRGGWVQWLGDGGDVLVGEGLCQPFRES